MIRKLSIALLATALVSPATAAVVVNAANVGQTFTINYTGKVNGSPAPAISTTQIYTFTGTVGGGTIYNFAVNSSNTSTVASRLRSFGFDVTSANIVSAGGTGTYGTAGFGDNFPEGAGVREVCFRATGGSNCTGGPNGLTSGSGTTSTISLIFGSALSSITLDNFVTRYQSISPALNGSTSGIGLPVVGPPVPEPATWALMIGGFGAIGATMRRRRATIAFG